MSKTEDEKECLGKYKQAVLEKANNTRGKECLLNEREIFLLDPTNIESVSKRIGHNGKPRLDETNFPDLRVAIESITKQDPQVRAVVVDLSKIGFISSASWWVFIGVQKELNKRQTAPPSADIPKSVFLVDLDQDIKTTLKLTGMNEYFGIIDTNPQRK